MILLVFFQFIHIYIVSKILDPKLKFLWKEIPLVFMGGLVLSQTYRIVGVYSSVLLFILLFIISYIIKKNVFKSISSIVFSMVIIIISDHLATFIESVFLKKGNLRDLNLFAHLLISIVLSIFIVLSVKKVNKGKEYNYRVNYFVVVTTGFVLITYYMSIFLGYHIGNSIEIIKLNTIFFIIYLLILIIVFYFYSISLRNIYRVKQKEIEFQSMERYTTEIEKQYKEMRKFRHDYQNILISMSSYIEEKDYFGLEQYFNKYIKNASNNIEINNFKLGNLSRIKVKEIKSLLSSKLLTAQEHGIDASIEVVEDINHIPVDPVILVRILGIVLDNAIEELQELKQGKLLVGFIKDKNSIIIIVQNTCRKNIEKLHRLKKEGYSTRGGGRGLGFSNLNEMIQKCSNVISETIIDDQVFIQKIIITRED